MIKKHLKYSLNQFYRIKNKFVRFLFVGVINTVFSLSIYSIFIFIGVHYTIAVFVANALGILFNYKTTGKLVFEHSDNKLIYKFVLVYMITYFLNVGGIKFLLSLNVDKYTAAVISAIPIAIISFLLNKRFVFKNKLVPIPVIDEK